MNNFTFETIDLRSFLVKNTVFKHLNDSELDSMPIYDGADIYKRGDMVYHQGTKISGFYCVVKGIIKIFKTGVDGKDMIIRFAKPGDIMGFRSTITGEMACTSTRVIEDALVCFIPASLVTSFVKSNGEFAMDLLELSCKELGEANDYIADIAQKSVRERLAEVLIHLKWSFDLDNENFLQISLTREELANLVGTATESVIRFLSEFKNDNLIELKGRRIKFLDEEKLIKTANMVY